MITKRKLQEWLSALPDDADVSFTTERNKVQDEDIIHLIAVEDDKWNRLIKPLDIGYPWGVF